MLDASLKSIQMICGGLDLSITRVKRQLPMQNLASVSLLGTYPDKSDADLAEEVKKELQSWFGDSVTDWQLLRNYRIPYAQPNQARDFLHLHILNSSKCEPATLASCICFMSRSLQSFAQLRIGHLLLFSTFWRGSNIHRF